MARVNLTVYTHLEPMPGVAVHPDGYIVDQNGDVVKRAICPIPSRGSNRLIDNLTPGQVYTYQDTFRCDMGTVEQRQNFIEALAVLGKYTPVMTRGEVVQHPHIMGAHMKCAGVFWELITLPLDQRVILGPVVCRKLAKDFENWSQRARAMDINLCFEDAFYKQFRGWGAQFMLAANHGLVNIY